MRVLVCGGRGFDDWKILSGALSDIFHSMDDGDVLTVIQGGAKGADFLARVWAKDNLLPREEYQADWKIYGRAAGHIRNQRMLDEGKPNLVLAFEGGTGTADMVRRAKAANIEVKEIK